MDGTGTLFDRLLRALPSEILPSVVRYPTQTNTSPDALLSMIEEGLPVAEPFVVLAESFSGPLALRLAARRPAGLRALVMVATFIRNPWPPLLAKLSWALGALLALPMPRRVVELLLVGQDSPADLVSEVSAAIRAVRPSVLASWLRQVLSVDVSEEARRCPVPILYLKATGDRLVAARAERVLRAVKSELVTVSIDAPHLLLQRRPVEASDAILRFIRELSP